MNQTTSPFRSNFYMWNGVSAIFFSNYITNVHSHNTLQIVADLHAQFRCRTGDTSWKTYKNIIIREDTPHQLDTKDSVQLIIYLDTETTAARIISERYLQDKQVAEPDLDLFRIISPNILQQALLKPDATTIQNIVSRVLQALTVEITGTAPPKPDSRIQSTRATIDTIHPGDLSIAALAARVHLSASRLSALFKQHTGIPLYRYILWSRIRFAINHIMTGHPINDAAWEAGFHDNSHFHKMLVTMFGISPSQFLRDNRTMDILTCDVSPLYFETTVYDDHGQVEKVYK
jgi:AraC-like DNA-binding protein